jgi:hypothetical protein
MSQNTLGWTQTIILGIQTIVFRVQAKMLRRTVDASTTKTPSEKQDIRTLHTVFFGCLDRKAVTLFLDITLTDTMTPPKYNAQRSYDTAARKNLRDEQ